MSDERYVTVHGGGIKEAAQRVPNGPVSALSGLVSILIPCCGQLEYTRLCVPSVLRFTRDPYELIFIDIGSLDGTAEYLAGIKAASRVHVEIVRTPTDSGISDACKTAIQKAAGEYLVLLNNDTVVTEAWLDQLLGLVKMSPAIGMTGPMSNYAAPPQLIETVPYRVGPRKGREVGLSSTGGDSLIDVEAVNRFAGELREKNRGKWLESDRLGGFCLLLKRQVLKKMEEHGLNEWSDLSLFDTDILSSKARQAGFTLACCRDLFIHHFGTRTFAHGASRGKDEKRNQITI